MFCEPRRSDFRNYGDYALSVLGYAILADPERGSGDLRGRRGIFVDVLPGSGASRLGRPGVGDSRGDGFKRQLASALAECSVRGDDSGGRCGGVASVETSGGERGGVSEGKREASVLRDVGLERGPNWERNRKWREKKRRAKDRREAVGSDAGGDVARVDAGDVGGGDGEPQGFWRSCSQDVRQKLIDSKARMHIAENERRARQARLDVERMDSPVAILENAMRSVKLAQTYAKDKGDSKVAGWAETVATSYAESIAKSAPSTVPSYASVVSAATSVSVDGSKRIKPGTLRWFQFQCAAVKDFKGLYKLYGALNKAKLPKDEHHEVDLLLDTCRDSLNADS